MQPRVPCTTLRRRGGRRQLWDAKIIGGKVYKWVYKWLERRGIHLYDLYTEADTPPEEGSTPLPKGAATAAGTALGESVHAIQVTDGRLEARSDRLGGRARGAVSDTSASDTSAS